jgi:hypothetical protein
MSENRTLYIEEAIIKAIKQLLVNEVNDILSKAQFVIPAIEFGNYEGGSVVTPVIALSTCERTEKERIVKQDAYTLTINFSLTDTKESELHIYAYSSSVSRAIYDNPILSGIINRTTVTGKKYFSPKKPQCGEGWGLVITLRLTVEGAEYAC